MKWSFKEQWMHPYSITFSVKILSLIVLDLSVIWVGVSINCTKLKEPIMNFSLLNMLDRASCAKTQFRSPSKNISLSPKPLDWITSNTLLNLSKKLIPDDGGL